MPKRLKGTKPKAGNEEQVSSTAREVLTWTEVDASGAFTSTKGTSNSIIAEVALGIDHAFNSTQSSAEIRFRETGDSIDWEDAIGTAGTTKFIEVDSAGEYLSGGFTETVTIPVSSAGKFDYQLRNYGFPPRSIVRITECLTDFDLPDSAHRLKPQDAALPDATYPLYSKLVANNYDNMVLIYSDTESQYATWELPNFTFNADTDNIQVIVWWIPFAGANGDNVKWDFGLYGAKDGFAWDGALTTGTFTDQKIASSAIHVAPKFITGAEAEFLNRDTTIFRIGRDITVANNLAAPAYFLSASVEVYY